MGGELVRVTQGPQGYWLSLPHPNSSAAGGARSGGGPSWNCPTAGGHSRGGHPETRLFPTTAAAAPALTPGPHCGPRRSPKWVGGQTACLALG